MWLRLDFVLAFRILAMVFDWQGGDAFKSQFCPGQMEQAQNLPCTCLESLASVGELWKEAGKIIALNFLLNTPSWTCNSFCRQCKNIFLGWAHFFSPIYIFWRMFIIHTFPPDVAYTMNKTLLVCKLRQVRRFLYISCSYWTKKNLRRIRRCVWMDFHVVVALNAFCHVLFN